MTNKIPGRLFIRLSAGASFMLGKALATRPIRGLGGRRGKGGGSHGESVFQAPSNLKHLLLSGAAKRMWLTQIKKS